MSSVQLKNGVRAWHEELLEYLLVNPRASLQEISFYFNATPSWISIVRNSDAFKELYAQRRQAHFDRVSITVADRVIALADVTLDALTVKMEKHIAADTATIDQLKEVGDMALKALGFGAKSHTNVNINAPTTNQNVFVDKGTLERAREARRQVQARETPPLSLENLTVDGEFVKLTEDKSAES